MITPTNQEHAQEVKHIWWDVCNCESCLDEAAKINDDAEDLPRKRKSSQQILKRRYEKGDPTVGLLGEPSGKFDYYVLYPKAEPNQPPSPSQLPSPHKPRSPPPHKLSPYNQKALSILHQDSPTKDKEALNQVEPVDVSDLESLYSLDDKPSDSVLYTIAYSDLSFDDDSDKDSLEGDSNFGVHMINPIPYVLPRQEDPPLPLTKIHLLTDAYTKPIPVIAFFDTGSSVSILNPNILPDHYWKPHHQNSMAANGEKFFIDKISIPINIWLLPKCVIKRRLLDVIPTKASHPGMNPDHYQLAKEECEELVSQDARVLSKFDLKSGFWQLDARVLSKFDLKSGFWQLVQYVGIPISAGITASVL
nr:putative zinc finger, CCHC-type [Tanacetum cinerariifolium]